MVCSSIDNYASANNYFVPHIIKETQTMATNPQIEQWHSETLNRVCADVIITETVADYLFVMEQTINGSTDRILINKNEIDSLIEVLRTFQEAVRE